MLINIFVQNCIEDKFIIDQEEKRMKALVTGGAGFIGSNVVKYLLDKNKKQAGLIGTIEYIFKNTTIPAKLTTPDCISIQKYLKEMDEILKTKNLTNEILGKAIDKLHKHTLNEMSIIRKALSDIQKKLPKR